MWFSFYPINLFNATVVFHICVFSDELITLVAFFWSNIISLLGHE